MPRARAPQPRTDAGDAFSGLVVEILRTADMLRTAGDALAHPSGLTSAQWRVLAVLEVAPMTVAEVARHLGLTRQSVQRVTDTVVTAGFAEYVDNPSDRRAQLAQLTAAGAAALRQVQRRQAAWANRCAQGIPAADLRAAQEFLAGLAPRLER